MGRSEVLYDGARVHEALDTLVAPLTEHPDPLVRSLAPVLGRVLRGQYKPALKDVLAFDWPDDALRREFAALLNAELLPSRRLLWTVHGATRAFRFWSPRERRAYVQATVDVAEALTGLTPDVSFGFGSVLAVVRDRALIPHDDDLDLIVAFERQDAPSIAAGLELVETHLGARGFTVTGS